MIWQVLISVSHEIRRRRDRDRVCVVDESGAVGEILTLVSGHQKSDFQRDTNQNIKWNRSFLQE